jgi:long-subunit acyl-CoA synthetase (AMP-forming)
MLFKIVDTETGALLPRGKEGEVVCAGPNVMLGYLNNPKANAETFDKDGWMRTGDIGMVVFLLCLCHTDTKTHPLSLHKSLSMMMMIIHTL